MPKILVIFLALAAALAACNTIEGAGQDVSAAGDAVTGEAREAQQGM
jgi:predicted small secreted protein